MSNKPISEMTDDEIREGISALQRMQPPPREAKKPRRVGEPKADNPNKRKSWKDDLLG